jgi:hypothetical protein
VTPPSLRSAVGYGVVGTAGGSLIMLVAGVPAAEAILLAVVVPALVALGLAAAQAGRRLAWLRAAAGLLAGSALCVVVVVGLISGLAYLLSDPG